MPNGTRNPIPGAISMKTCIPCGIQLGLGIGIPDDGPMRNGGTAPIGGNPKGVYKTNV